MSAEHLLAAGMAALIALVLAAVLQGGVVPLGADGRAEALLGAVSAAQTIESLLVAAEAVDVTDEGMGLVVHLPTEAAAGGSRRRLLRVEPRRDGPLRLVLDGVEQPAVSLHSLRFDYFAASSPGDVAIVRTTLWATDGQGRERLPYVIVTSLVTPTLRKRVRADGEEGP